MTTNLTYDGIDPFEDPVDRLLAQIALEVFTVRPSLHNQVGGRYEAVRRKLESTPEFENAIEHFYRSVSMAIDATISTRGTDDEYDLDIVAHVLFSPNVAIVNFGIARARALRLSRLGREASDPLRHSRSCRQNASRHYSRISCLKRGRAREFITHAKGPHASQEDRFVDMNAFGFAGWYRQRTPIEFRLAESFDRHWRSLGGQIALDEAQVDADPRP